MLDVVLQSLLAVVAATLIFTVGMPLLGFLAGLVVRVILPYLLIPLAASVLLLSLNPSFSYSGILGVFTLLWVVLVLGTRRALVSRHALELPWFQGHYRAAASLLSLGSLGRLVLPLAGYLNRHIPEEELELVED